VDRALYRGKIRAEYRQERLKEIKEAIGKHWDYFSKPRMTLTIA
jgi:hypothetical protein